jgi:hypothetical protein
MTEIWLIAGWLADPHAAQHPLNAADHGRGDGPDDAPSEDPRPIEAPSEDPCNSSDPLADSDTPEAAARGEVAFRVDRSYGNCPFAA